MYKVNDVFYKKAKKNGFLSRAAYKLIEINKKYKILTKNDKVLDIGAAPGGWSQVSLNFIGNGIVVALDLSKIKIQHYNNCYIINSNLNDPDVLNKIIKINKQYDVVLSDIAPNTSGDKFVDHINSINLVTMSYSILKSVLKKNGNFVVKLFEGKDRDVFFQKMKNNFFFTKIYKPCATRKSSSELYIVCKGYNG